MEFENTIGLETHVQLKTKTKMFCSCLLKTGCEPNTNVCPVCLGYPGALPVMSKEAVKLTVMSGMMLGCEINKHATFDRKNYFYPDMAKDYQISENGNPLCIGGGVEITRADGTKKFIRINHIHLEEDAAKINHYAQSSGVDFNRGGTPLMEIVSEPDMESADDAILYLTALKEMLVYAGVSACNLEEGNMRSDVNISIRPKTGEGLPLKADGKIDFSKLGTKVEIKNMNTFKGIHAALCYEAKRQRECMAHSIPIVQETRRWDGEVMETASMRSKENAHDYRYFPEPDLVPVELSQEQVDEWRKLLPEKPEVRRARMVADYGIAEYDAEVLSQHKDNADYFEAACGVLKEEVEKKGGGGQTRLHSTFSILVDGLPVRTLPNSTNVIKGDAKSLFIAAASILAKTARDEDCFRLEREYPGYGFAKHKGYPTPEHLKTLVKLGPCPEHRRSFGPVSQMELGL